MYDIYIYNFSFGIWCEVQICLFVECEYPHVQASFGEQLFILHLTLCLCQNQLPMLCESVFLSTLTSIDIIVFLVASKRLYWLLYLYNKCWKQIVLALWICSFSDFVWLSYISYISIWILELAWYWYDRACVANMH